MRSPSLVQRRAWLLAALIAVAFVSWATLQRTQHVRDVTALPEWSVDAPTPDASSPTGYAKSWRRLILPEHANPSYEWIAQTQLMLAADSWRLRHVDYDNAPDGRTLETPSPYRLWLAALAKFDSSLSNRPLAVSVERAALWADPLLLGLVLVSTAGFAARFFGPLPAAGVALAAVSLFPFAAHFVGAAPGPDGLALACIVWSLLPVAAALRRIYAAPDALPSQRSSWLFALAGIAGAIGLWINPDYQWQATLALAISGAAAHLLVRRTSAVAALEKGWRMWGLCGCATSLIAFAIEYFPDAMTLRLDRNHPLYALAWLGLGELVARSTRIVGEKKSRATFRNGFALAASLAAVGALPIAMIWSGDRSWLPDSPDAARLTPGASSAVATSVSAWITRDGMSAEVWITLFPLAAAILAILIASRRSAAPELRVGIIAMLGPIAMMAAIGTQQLRAWSYLDAATLALIAVVATRPVAGARTFLQWAAVAAFAVSTIGIARIWPERSDGERTFTAAELQGAIERDLAHWLAQREGRNDVVVFAPPDLTTSLFFHGGLRGIGTLNPANRDGFAAATRIASATSRDEARTLLEQRRVSYIVIPSWDNFLDRYVQLGLQAAPGSPQFEKSLVADLHQWNLPPWLMPVPYRLPTSPTFADLDARVFQVVEDQDRPTALARLADYLIETNRIALAASLREELRRFPADIGALVALAQIEAARGDMGAFSETVKTLLPYVETPAVRRVRWDRRVALATVLVQANQLELARDQVRRCVADANETQVRRLSAASLLRFHALCRLAGTPIEDGQLRQLALDLLPPDLRQRLN